MAAIMDTVNPGDVISADLMRRMIAMLNVHEALLVGNGALSITNVQPPVLRVGEELKVFGTGLGAATLSEISVEGSNVPLGSVKAGSSDGLLIFDVPALMVPTTGKIVVVTVVNKAGASAFASFYALPALITNLEASFNIKRTTVNPPGVLAINTSYDFTFSIEAFTSLDETYTLEPKVLGAPAGWSVAMKSGGTEILIPKSQPAPTTTSVVVVVTTGAAGGGTLTLGLRGKNFAGVTASSMPEAISIGVEPGAPNLDVEFLSPTVLGSVQKFANGSLYIRTDANTANQKAIINPLNVRLRVPGAYTIGVPVVGDPKWTVTITNNPLTFDTTGTPNAIRGILFNVSAQAGAPDADVEIPVTGAGALPHGSFKFKAKLRADPSNPNPL